MCSAIVTNFSFRIVLLPFKQSNAERNATLLYSFSHFVAILSARCLWYVSFSRPISLVFARSPHSICLVVFPVNSFRKLIDSHLHEWLVLLYHMRRKNTIEISSIYWNVLLLVFSNCKQSTKFIYKKLQ